jgi:rhodanese-related sulfurtransferase
MKKSILIIIIILSSVIMLDAQIRKLNSSDVNDILKKNHDFIVIDVRTEEEFKAGHIKGAININIRQPDAFVKIDKLNRKAKYIVYCRTSNRSKVAVDYMVTKGFMNIYHMMDGFVGWLQNGFPIEK